MTDLAFLIENGLKGLKPGEIVDGYRALKELRLAMAKEVESVEAVEKSFKQWMIDNIDSKDSRGVFGLMYKAVITTKQVPRIDNENGQDGWRDLYQHIYNTGEFELLSKRLSDKAVMERIEAGETIPGVTTMTVKDVSVTKV